MRWRSYRMLWHINRVYVMSDRLLAVGTDFPLGRPVSFLKKREGAILLHMESRLKLFGHPIHTMVVGFPIGLYTTALACDALYLVLNDAFWFRMAYWAIVFGLVTHLAAIATGLPDFLAIMRERNPARRPATSHVIFGVSLLVVQVLKLRFGTQGTYRQAAPSRCPSLSISLP